MPHKTRSTYAISDSVFFKLRSRARLARILFSSTAKFTELCDENNHYREWTQPKEKGGIRHIEAPREDLKRLQSRIADLLGRITPPDFLFNPVKGRSYVENAARHLNARTFHMLDIADYFPSCTAKRVAWLFGTKMQCSKDVTAILVKLTTRNGHLPQGSPCSPILAYLCHVDMWEKISEIITNNNCKLSVYADDITISGNSIPGKLIWAVKKEIHKCGFRLKKNKETRIIESPADITGVIVRKGQLFLPNRQHQKLSNLQKELNITKSVVEREALIRKIRGRRSQRLQIEKTTSFSKPS